MPADTSQPSLKEVLRQKRAAYILEVAETVLLEKVIETPLLSWDCAPDC